MDESGLDSTHSASNIDDNIISREKPESSQDQNDGGKPSQNANQLMLDLHISAVQTPLVPYRKVQRIKNAAHSS